VANAQGQYIQGAASLSPGFCLWSTVVLVLLSCLSSKH